MLSKAIVEAATRRALASGVLQPIESDTTFLEDGGVRFVVRAVSSLARKDQQSAGKRPEDPLGDYEPDLFVADLPPAHYVLLNKYPVVAGHLLVVTRHFERQDRLLTIGDFAALGACLNEVEGLGFYNGGMEAGASQGRKHLQLVPLPLAPGSPGDLPMERLLHGGADLPFIHTVARLAWPATPGLLHAVYRELVGRCGISAAEGGIQSAPYNLLMRRTWMVIVPRSRGSFESISVNALGFAGSLFVRSQEALERVRAVGPMQVLRAVALSPPAR